MNIILEKALESALASQRQATLYRDLAWETLGKFIRFQEGRPMLDEILTNAKAAQINHIENVLQIIDSLSRPERVQFLGRLLENALEDPYADTDNE